MICDRNPVETNCDCGITYTVIHTNTKTGFLFQGHSCKAQQSYKTPSANNHQHLLPSLFVGGRGGHRNQEHHHHPAGGKDCNDGVKEKTEREKMSVSERGSRWMERGAQERSKM